MSNLCTHTDVTKRALLALTLSLSIVTVCNTCVLAAGSDQVESVLVPAKADSESNSDQKSDDLLKNSVKGEKTPQNPAKKPLIGKKSSLKPLGTRDDTSTSNRLRQMLAMVVVIIILGGICWVVCKKFMPRLKGPAGIKGRDVKIIETTYIAPRQPVHLLQVGSKKLLIAGGKDGLKMLADVTDDFSTILNEQDTDAEAKS